MSKKNNIIEKFLLFLVFASFIFAGAFALDEIFNHPSSVTVVTINETTIISASIPGTNMTCKNATLVNGFYFCNVDDITGGILK